MTKFKTKNLIVEAEQDDHIEDMWKVTYNGKMSTFRHSLFNLLFEPAEEDKRETFVCYECKKECYSYDMWLLSNSDPKNSEWNLCKNCR